MRKLCYFAPRLNSSGFCSVCSHFHCINQLRIKPFLFLSVGQQWVLTPFPFPFPRSSTIEKSGR